MEMFLPSSVAHAMLLQTPLGCLTRCISLASDRVKQSCVIQDKTGVLVVLSLAFASGAS